MVKTEKTQEELRAEWRAMYARQYPPGFKRRRNAEQKAKQKRSQKRYGAQQHVIHMRRVRRLAARFLVGKNPAAQELFGCTPAELRAHLDATLCSGALQWHLCYHRHPREFDLDCLEDRKACFHYTNLYARKVCITTAPFPPPSRRAPSQAGSSHAVLETPV